MLTRTSERVWNTVYLGIGEGKIRQKVTPETPESVNIKYNIGGKEYDNWYLMYEGLSGTLTGIEQKESDYGVSINLTFAAEGDVLKKYQLQLKRNGTTNKILMLLSCADLSQPVTIKAYSYTDKRTGEIRHGADVQQRRISVGNRYWDDDKKAYTADLPAVKEVMLKGKPVFDDTQRFEFLYQAVSDKLMSLGSTQIDTQAADEVVVESDDLPF